MGAATTALLNLDSTFARELEGLFVPWRPAVPPAPGLVVLNEQLAAELGLDPRALGEPRGVALLAGAEVAAGSTPIAQAYAGHQFGFFQPSLGDGRAVLLGELVDIHGRRRDLHLKGSGATPFSRGADGRAALGPMLRECVVGEAMHALGIPTSRALAVTVTGERVPRQRMEPGAVLARVAASHVRVGTFQYAATRGGPELVRRLADYVIDRHHPQVAAAPHRHRALLEAVLDVQAQLIARWMNVGFIHGVMNTDNMTLSGETIDYGPCAFMDVFDPATVFSSIDETGRYAYGNQPGIALWNLTRLAETLLPLLDDDEEAAIAWATETLAAFPERHEAHRQRGMRAKLGLVEDSPETAELADDLLALLARQRVDFTSALRRLSGSVRGDAAPVRSLFAAEPEAFDAWAARWHARLRAEGREPAQVAAAMDAVNPLYIPRNHLVEEALTDAEHGDLGTLDRLLGVVSHPFEERPSQERFAEPASAEFSGGYRTFCGT